MTPYDDNIHDIFPPDPQDPWDDPEDHYRPVHELDFDRKPQPWWAPAEHWRSQPDMPRNGYRTRPPSTGSTRWWADAPRSSRSTTNRRRSRPRSTSHGCLWAEDRDVVVNAKTPAHVAGGICWFMGRANDLFGPNKLTQVTVQRHLGTPSTLSS